MSTTPPGPLQWSAQFNVIPDHLTPKLHGDKIILPQSALEQLLSAATVTVPLSLPPEDYGSSFDPFNPHTFAAERQARSQVFERQSQLPHPLIFRLVNSSNGNVAYAGIREFSAEEDHVGLSPFLRQALGLQKEDEGLDPDSNERAKVTVHAKQLSKGTYVRFRPLEAGYDPEDWKALLERHMRDTFTTLTNGEMLTIPSGKEEYRFLVDKVLPEGDGICIVDTDLEVEIEPLNEEQARESLKRRLEKTSRANVGDKGNSVGGTLVVGQLQIGQVLPGSYIDYTLKEWDHSKGIKIELESADSDGALDLLVSPLAHRQRVKPRENEHVFGDLSGRPSKRLKIEQTNVEFEGAEAVYLSVYHYSNSEQDAENARPQEYSVRITPIDSSQNSAGTNTNGIDEPPRNPDETRCENCYQWVPKRTMMLHENFCFRNNILCPHCNEVYKKNSEEWKSHWHCPHDDSHGNTKVSHSKHNDLFHMKRTCTDCGYEANCISDLAHHRTSTCPAKQILCQFCHLLVPQQGPDDPDPSDPEVILSGLTPHELADGGRTTECHMCGKIVRLRDMSIHLKHHDLSRLSRPTPRLCRDVNCGRTLDGVGSNGQIKQPRRMGNDIGLCEACYGPLYNSSFDPDGKALRRRVERRYLTQFLTGCGKDWCRNEYCKIGRKHLGLERPGEPVTSKEAMGMIKPILEHLMDGGSQLHFCTDEASQKRRVLAEMIAAEGSGAKQANGINGSAYQLPWCIAALEAESGDLGKARTWLSNWAPTKAEATR